MLRHDILLITSSETRPPDFQSFRKLIFEALNFSCMCTLKDIDLAVRLVFEMLSLRTRSSGVAQDEIRHTSSTIRCCIDASIA